MKTSDGLANFDEEITPKYLASVKSSTGDPPIVHDEGKKS